MRSKTQERSVALGKPVIIRHPEFWCTLLHYSSVIDVSLRISKIKVIFRYKVPPKATRLPKIFVQKINIMVRPYFVNDVTVV